MERKDATVLYSLKSTAFAAGNDSLNELPGPLVEYCGLDWLGDAAGEPKYVRTWADEETLQGVKPVGAEEQVLSEDKRQRLSVYAGLPAPAALRLRVGIPVILIRNDESKGISNGMRGIVTDFCRDSTVGVHVQNQLQAWQNAKLPQADRLAGELRGLHETICAGGRWPVVQYTNKKGFEVSEPMLPELFTRDDQHGTVICARMQVPVIIGTALTMHRAQGMTLPKVIVSCDNIFACGQFYGAVGRCKEAGDTRLEGSMKSNMPLTDVRVLEWEAKQSWINVDNGPVRSRGQASAC